MKYVDCHLADQIYTHIDPTDGTVRHFNASAMIDACKTGHCPFKRLIIPIEPLFVQLCLEQRGIEPHRLVRLTTEQLDDPILGARFPDGTTLTVDGHHRYVRRYQLNHKTITMWVMFPLHWKRFLIDDLPTTNSADLLSEYSGL
jgi:hypothetical protein